MLRLVTPTPEGDPVPNRIARHAVATDDEHRRLIDKLVDARLVTSDERVVELAHESLARAWPRLRDWLDDDVEGQRILRHLAAASEAWDAMGRPDSELYRGPRLAQAVEWRDRSHPDLNPVERQFLADAEAAGRPGTARRRGPRPPRIPCQQEAADRSSPASAAALVVAIVAGLLAVRQADRADRTAELAERKPSAPTAQPSEAEQAAAAADRPPTPTSAIAADARRVGTQALVTENIDESLLMAAAGVQLDDSPDTRANLLTALTRHPALIAATRSAEPLLTVDASFDGGVVAVGDPFGGVAFHDAVTLAPLGSFPDPPWTLKFRPGGTTLAMAANPYNPNGPQQLDPVPVVIVDASTFEPADDPARRATGATGAGAEPRVQRRRAIPRRSVRGVRGRLRRTDGRRGRRLGPVGAPTSRCADSTPPPWLRSDGWASAPTARSCTPADSTARVSVRDVATGELVRSVDIAHVGGEVSPDGAVVAVADGRDVVLLDAATLTEQRRLEGQADLTTLQFSRDGTRFASGYDDGTVIVWDVATGAVQDQFNGHAGGVTELAFSPDGATLYTVSLDRSLLAWDLDGSRRFVAIGQAPATPGNADYAIVVADRRSGHLRRRPQRQPRRDAVPRPHRQPHEPGHRGRPRRHRRRARHDRRSTARSPRADATGWCVSGTARHRPAPPRARRRR